MHAFCRRVTWNLKEDIILQEMDKILMQLHEIRIDEQSIPSPHG